MDTQLIIALLGFAGAALGLLGALLGRKKEIIHRHIDGPEESKRGFTALGYGGLLILFVGLAVALGMLMAHFPFSVVDAGLTSEKDLEKMQGEWKVEKAVWHGEEEAADVRLKRTVWFDGSTLTVRAGNRVLKSEVTVDPSKKPAAIDITPSGEKTLLGIYKIDGDMLSLCWNELGRPGTFESSGKNEDPGLVLFVLRRGKK